MYNLKYKYNKNDFPDMDVFLKNLYKRSCQYYLETNQDIPSIERRKDLESIYKFVNYTEDYIFGLVKLGFVNSANIDDVLTELKKIQSISVLPKNLRGLFGVTTPDYRIAINPNLNSSKYLTSEERTLLYIGHEVGHIIHKMWVDDIDMYIKNLRSSNNSIGHLLANFSLANQYCISEGVSLLDEATVQEAAEAVTYHISKKERPPFVEHKHPKIYNGESYSSNFDYYSELEEPAILFGRTLRGVGEINDYSSQRIIKDLTKKSFSKDFITSIIDEYKVTPVLEEDFFYTMLCLGRIKDASYGLFGKGNFSDSTSLSQKYFSNLKFLSKKNEDFRAEAAKKI